MNNRIIIIREWLSRPVVKVLEKNYQACQKHCSCSSIEIQPLLCFLAVFLTLLPQTPLFVRMVLRLFLWWLREFSKHFPSAALTVFTLLFPNSGWPRMDTGWLSSTYQSLFFPPILQEERECVDYCSIPQTLTFHPSFVRDPRPLLYCFMLYGTEHFCYHPR